MNFQTLLGNKLKDDVVIDVLESCDIRVWYEFDRSHEGMADLYWAEAPVEGFILRFNEKQILDTVFLYAQASEGIDAINVSDIEFAVYQTFDAAEEGFRMAGVPFKQSAGAVGTNMHKWWIKGDFGSHSRHYQFHEGALFRITLSRGE